MAGVSSRLNADDRQFIFSTSGNATVKITIRPGDFKRVSMRLCFDLVR